MRNLMLFTCFMLLVLTACAQPKVVSDVPAEVTRNNIKQDFGEKCENAKYQLEKTVEEGQLTNLRELKRNIELYCIWRRN